MFERFAGKGKCQNPSVCKGLRNFGILRMGGGVTRSQTTRATNCATPGYIYFLVCFLLIIFLLSVRGASLRNIVA
jgi:hypothetical protein